MHLQKEALILLSLVAAFSRVVGAAEPNGPLVQHTLSLAMAMTMAQESMAICKADGFNVTVVVVDRSGTTILLLRSDTANPHNPELARRKAYTALTFRQSSRDWAQMLISTPAIAAQRDLKEVIALGGGVPVMWGDEPIGAIGVSGATILNEDDHCAHAGAAAVASLLSLKGAQK